MERVDLPGAAHLVLADGVVHLDPERAVFDAMPAGWERQQRTRFLKCSGWYRALRSRAIRNGIEAEVTAIITEAVQPAERTELGSLLFTGISEENRLTDDEHESYFGRDRTPAEPMNFNE